MHVVHTDMQAFTHLKKNLFFKERENKGGRKIGNKGMGEGRRRKREEGWEGVRNRGREGGGREGGRNKDH